MRARGSQAFLARFWSKVNTSGGPDACWPWTGAQGGQGYGVFYTPLHLEGKKASQMRAHRLSLELLGERIPKGMGALHSCDVRRCCNQRHLRAGTAADNNRDMVSRGRHSHGETCKLAKLTDKRVLCIRARLEAGDRQVDVARDEGVSLSLISLVERREKWHHLPPSKHWRPRDRRVGQFNHTASLSEEVAAEVIVLRAGGMRICDIARHAGVPYQTAYHISHGHTWKHLKRPAQSTRMVKTVTGELVERWTLPEPYQQRKLCEEDVRAIRRRIGGGEKNIRGIARSYPNASYACVLDAAIGRTWRWVD